MGRYRRELSVALAYALLLGVLWAVAPSFYDGGRQLGAILLQSAPVLVCAVGMTLVMLARHIDISIGSQFSLCAVTAGLLAQAGLPMPLVAVGTLLAGAGFGAVNGALVAGLGLPSIVVTLATLVIYRDGLRWWRQGQFVKDLPADFQWLGMGQATGQWVIVGVALVVFVTFALGLRYLSPGRAVYATGSDPEAARLAGIRPRRVVFAVFVLMGTLAGLGALLSAVCLPQVDPKLGDGLELKVIAAVVVGGVAVSGGRGTLVGPLLGVALLDTVRPALVFLSAGLHKPPQAHWEMAIQGAIILVAVASEAIKLSRRKDAGRILATH
ncbi:MAG TPA: ABC transporter permease [Gemmataceae bacterium]|nr:ABC transporter permease [Gemmataceae bacterium]